MIGAIERRVGDIRAMISSYRVDGYTFISSVGDVNFIFDDGNITNTSVVRHWPTFYPLVVAALKH